MHNQRILPLSSRQEYRRLPRLVSIDQLGLESSELHLTSNRIFAVLGIYFYEHSFDKIRTLRPSGRGGLEITNANGLYIKRRKLTQDILEVVLRAVILCAY